MIHKISYINKHCMMYVYVYTYLLICIYLCIYIYMYIHIATIYTYIYYIFFCIHTCIYMYICICIYTYICTCICWYTFICMYTYMYIYIYTHIYYFFSYSCNKHFFLSPFTPKKNLKLNCEISNRQGLFDAGKRKIAQCISVQHNLTFFWKIKIQIDDKIKIDVQKHCKRVLVSTIICLFLVKTTSKWCFLADDKSDSSISAPFWVKTKSKKCKGPEILESGVLGIFLMWCNRNELMIEFREIEA